MKTRLRALFRLPYLPVWLAPLVLFAPLLLAGKALYWGTPYLQFVPWWSYAWEALRQGHLPLWNALAGMGAPLLANYQSALFYPPHWLYFLLAAAGGAPALAWGQALLVAAHLAWAGLGMVFLARRLGLGVLAQTIAGLCFGLCGYLVARGSFLSILSTAAWLPWILYFLTGEGGKRETLLLSLALALQLLAGHAQTAAYTLILAAGWSGYWGWVNAHSQITIGKAGGVKPGKRGKSREGRLELSIRVRGVARAWLRLALAVALAVALAAVQLFPTGEYLLQSQRASAVDYELAMTYSFWPWRLLTLLAPGMYGSPAQGNYWGYGNYWEDAAYIGLLPLLLAAAAVLGRRRSPAARWKPFLVVLMLVAFLLALGKNTPVFPWLFQNVPGFDMFQAPARYLIWVEVALALLAATGAQGWRRPEGRGLYWTRLGTAGALAVSLGAGLAWLLMGEVSPTFIQATALAGAWGVGAGVLTLLAPPGKLESAIGSEAGGNGHPNQPLQEKRWTWAVCLFVAADLVVAGWGLNPGAPLGLYSREDHTAAAAMPPGARLYIAEPDERELKFKRFFRFDSYASSMNWSGLQEALLPDSAMLSGIPSANNFDPLVPGRFARWMEALDEADAPARQLMLRRMNVGLIERAGQGAGGIASLEPVQPGGRARWAACGRAAQDERDARSQVMSPETDPDREVILESWQPEACTGADGDASISIEAETPNSVLVRVDSPQPGWLVLADVWYPGWRAEVDGAARPVYRADYLFRAVQVSAGKHTVSFSYRPYSFWLGAAVSLLGWAGWLWAFTRRRPGK